MSSTSISKLFFSPKNLILPLGFIILITACLLNSQTEKPEIQLTKQDTAINVNKQLLIAMSAGNKRLVTGLLWIQTLMESDLERYQKKDLNNWLFVRFDTIALLDPRFYENYLYGGQFLAIIKDDLEGASIIYKKGTSVYPDDYGLNFNAGFLHYYEMKDYPQGLAYLSKVKNNPKAPIFLQSIINKLHHAVEKDSESTFLLVKHQYETTPDDALRERLGLDLYALKAQTDLMCLNNKKPGCNYYDFDGKRYLEKEGSYFSQKKFKVYGIKRRGEAEASPLVNFIK